MCIMSVLPYRIQITVLFQDITLEFDIRLRRDTTAKIRTAPAYIQIRVFTL